MEKFYESDKYKDRVILENDSALCGLSILVICKQTGRCSSINNLNQMLEDLGVDPTKSKYEDSSWVLSRKEAQKLYKRTVRLFNNGYAKFLEVYLDEDRSYGEWEIPSTER
jgi:hypothetical protein